MDEGETIVAAAHGKENAQRAGRLGCAASTRLSGLRKVKTLADDI
jgi:hypothetical protein